MENTGCEAGFEVYEKVSNKIKEHQATGTTLY